MTDYFYTGKKGAGKSLCAVGEIQRYLAEGRRVATNLDLHMEYLLLPESKKTVTRLPDRPRIQDMIILGEGYDKKEHGYNEDNFGLIVLDECLSWLNSRNWNDKGRAELLDWFRHARKHGWDIIYIAQDIKALDKQMADSLCDYFGEAKRLDRVRIPFLSWFLKPFFGRTVTFPRAHAMSFYYGTSSSGAFYETKWYRGKDLEKAYDTDQIFSEDILYTESGPVDFRAPYTMLSPWHIKGRYILEEQKTLQERVLIFLTKLTIKAALLKSNLTGQDPVNIARQWGLKSKKKIKRRHDIIARTAIINGNLVTETHE